MKLILAFCLLSFGLNAQSKIKPFVKAGFYQCYLTNLRLNEFELGGGAQFNDYFSLGLNGRFGVRELTRTPYSNFKIGVISLESSYRILGEKFMFSPVIAYDAGIEVVNNGKGKLIVSDNFIYRTYSSYYYDFEYSSYDRGVYFGKAKILLSIRFRELDLLLGATYSTNILRFKSLNGHSSFYNNQFGFGFETSLKYTFPMKKNKKIAEKDLILLL